MAKFQVPTVGGIRKVIKTTTPATGTTIEGLNTVTLAQLAALISQIQAQQENNGGGNIGDGTEATLVPGPGLSGGGPMIGNVPIRLTAPIPWGLDDGGGGSDGDPGPPGAPGRAGSNGATGAQGPLGPAVFMAAEDGQDGQDAIPSIRGPSGANGTNGTNGAAGPTGPPGPILFLADDGQDGDWGPPGPAGTSSGGGGSLTVTDGTHTVSSVTNITVTGGTVGGSTPNATLTISGGSVALPGTIADLQTWFESDDILGASGAPIPRLRDRTPWFTGLCAQDSQLSSLLTVNPASINSLNTVTFNPSTSQGYTFTSPVQTSNGCTYFVVMIPNTNAASQAITGGAATSLCLYQNLIGSNALTLISGSTAVLAGSTANWVAGTAFQANVTYNISSGAYAFRQASAAAGSGTVTAGVGNLAHPVSFLGGDTATGNAALLVSSSLGLFLAYNRVLTGPEISSIEAYILAKWGV